MKKYLLLLLLLPVVIKAEMTINRPYPTLQEQDGTPSVRYPLIKVPNGSLTDGTTFASLTFGGGSGDAVLAATQTWTGQNTYLSTVTYKSSATFDSSVNFSSGVLTFGDEVTLKSAIDGRAIFFFNSFGTRLFYTPFNSMGIGTNSIDFYIGAAKVMTLGESGHLGLGTPNNANFNQGALFDVRDGSVSIHGSGSALEVGYKSGIVSSSVFMVEPASFSVYGDGNVGIGLRGNPQVKLHVAGTGFDAAVVIQNTISTPTAMVFLNPYQQWDLGTDPESSGTGGRRNFEFVNESEDTVVMVLSTGPGTVSILNRNPTPNSMFQVGGGTLTVFRSGYVGIGESNPDNIFAKLHVVDSNNETALILIQNTISSGAAQFVSENGSITWGAGIVDPDSAENANAVNNYTIRNFSNGTNDVIISSATGSASFISSVTVRSGNFYNSTADQGIILKSANSTCYKVTVSNAGALQTASVTCPN